MNWINRIASVVLFSISSAALAQTIPGMTHPRNGQLKSTKPTVAVGATLDTNGRLWLVKVDNLRLLVSRSDDGGQRFSAPVVVTPEQENISADGENRPKIAVASDGTVLLTWTQALAKNYSGNIRFSRSVDGGKNFSAPLTLNDDGLLTGHRFDSLAIDGAGKVVVTWLDARDRDAAKAKGAEFAGTSVYTAHSADNGANFTANRKVTDHTCECCRTATTWSAEGPVAFWRNLYGTNTRDFALANVDQRGLKQNVLDASAVRRVTDDNWQIDACPHHGGDIAAVGSTLHLVWFTNGKTRQGLFYKRIEGSHNTQPMPLGNAAAQAGHASVAAAGKTVLLSWREFNGRNYVAHAMRSNDGGISWGAPQQLAESSGMADYPVPLTDGKQALVVWNSASEGLRVLPVVSVPDGVAAK